MARDLFLGKIKRNFARDLDTVSPASDEVTFTFTDAEKQMLASAADLRIKADAGDKNAKKRLVAFTKNVAKLKAKAAKGDATSKRTLLVLRESGLFNKTQTFSLGWNPFSAKKESLDERAARVAKFASAVKSASKPEEIAKLSEQATYDQALKEQLLTLAQQGNTNALKVAAYSPIASTAVVGSSDNRANQLRQELARLRQKNPKTAEELRSVEQLEEKLTRLEAMSGIGYGPAYASSTWNRNPGKRLRRRVRKLAQIKARAASGDQQAVARLQQMQQRLSTRAATGDTQAAALLQQIQLPAGTNVPPSNSLYAPPPSQFPTATPSMPPTATPTNSPSYQPSAYAPAYTSPAYQPPYVPPYYQDADGNYYQTQPQPGQSQPTIDVFVGQRSHRRDEEKAAEQEDRGNVGWYGNSFVGGSSIVGNAIPHENYRVAVMKAAVKSAGGGRPSTKDYFTAKAAVDKVIGKSGITIYMPGAKPGRRTI